MAFNRPTLEQLIDRVVADFELRLSSFGKLIKNTFAWVIARVLAGLAHGVYGFLDFIALQVFPDTATDENLLRWGSIYGIVRAPATFAQGEITITGANGSIIPAGATLSRADGLEYRTLTEVMLSAGSATVQIRALVAGEDSNSDIGTGFFFNSTIQGVDSSALSTSQIGGGENEEPEDAYRARILARIQNPPLGGSASDYEQWALEVAGVTRAWVFPLYLGEGTVGLFFVKDGDSPIIPSSGDIEAVSANIDAQRPVTAKHFVFAPTADPVDFTIQLSPNTTPVQDNVTEELKDLFFRDAEPGGTILLSRMKESISIAQGELDHILIAPTSNFQSSDGFLPTLGSITFV